MSAPIPFVLKARYIRIDCDLKDEAGELSYPGFWFEARQNLTNGERRELVDALKAIDDQISVWHNNVMDRADDLDDEAALLRTRPDDAPDNWKADERALRKVQSASRSLLNDHQVELIRLDRMRRDLVTPYIRAWNLFEPSDEGEPIPVPPPVEGGAVVLEEAAPDLAQWMIGQCTQAYRSGKALSSSMTSGASQEPTNAPTIAGPQVVSTSNTRASRKRSASRSQ
jgi:hypothetical protein